jgi:hypothetical protein
MVVIEPAEQIVCEAGVAAALGIGLTTTVAVTGVPGHPFAVGVMVKVTITGSPLRFVNAPLISPVPLAAIPVTAVLLLVQLNVVPLTAPVNTIVVIVAPEQIVCDAGVATASGVGFTNTVAVIGVPGHPLAVGVIVKVTVTGAAVVLVKTPLISPAPLTAIPVTATVLSLDQLNTVPLTLPVNAIVDMAFAEQMVCEAGVATASGIGFTVMICVHSAKLPQPSVALYVLVLV